jgi:N-acyl-L-homoserine lactone synthetase
MSAGSLSYDCPYAQLIFPSSACFYLRVDGAKKSVLETTVNCAQFVTNLIFYQGGQQMNADALQSSPAGFFTGTIACRIQEEGYTTFWPADREQLQESYQLRARVFCHELGWVSSGGRSIEVDEFDVSAQHLVVTNSSGLVVATLRSLDCCQTWHMERYFINILPENFSRLKQPDSIEISRMAVDRGFRGLDVSGSRGVADLLYKGAFRFCMASGVSFAYCVVSLPVFKHMQMRGMPVTRIGPAVKMDDGVTALAAVLNWRTLFEARDSRSRELLNWFNDNTIQSRVA